MMNEEIFRMMMKKCLEYVTPFLDATPTTTITFDLWMNKGTHDTFVVVINFLTP
jgi:hypothetical protein